jgi:hypothetical protein
MGFAVCEVNMVRYCHNSPTNHVDPSGLWTWGDLWTNFWHGAVAGAIGAIIVVAAAAVIGVAVGCAVVVGASWLGMAGGAFAIAGTALAAGTTAATWTMCIAGAVGIVGMVRSLINDHSAENWAYNIGGLFGSGCVAFGGGKIGLNAKQVSGYFSPPGHEPPATGAYNPLRGFGLRAKRGPGQSYPAAFGAAMTKGPETVANAAAMMGAGTGAADAVDKPSSPPR